jgi:hypothetical protein
MMNLFKKIWGKITKKKEKNKMEQEQEQQPKKKVGKFIASTVLATALTVATNGGGAMGVTSCKQPTGSDNEQQEQQGGNEQGGNGGNEGGTGGNEGGTGGTNPSLPQYNGDGTAIQVSTLDLIALCNGSNAAVHNVINIGEAADIIETISPQLRNQAEKLYNFFDDAEGSYPALAAKFAVLKDAEAAIKSALTAGSLAPSARPAAVQGQGNIILNKIFEDNAGLGAEFNDYFDAYKQGKYLITADWNTRADPTSETTAAVNAFVTARNKIIGSITAANMVHDSGYYHAGRGVPLMYIGDNTSVDQQFVDMEDQMANRIVTALGITGAEQSKAEAMARALVIQLGQDHYEFQVFMDDLQAEQTNYAVDYSALLADNTVAAQVGPQSNVKLASVNPENAFDPESVKTAYGKPFEQYAGSFFPYNKEDRLA